VRKAYRLSLWWRPLLNRSEGWQRSVTIRSGMTFELALFARLESEPTKYFVFDLENESSTDPAPRIPEGDIKFDDTGEFIAAIFYSYARQRLKFSGTMQKEFDGRLTWHSEGESGSF